MPTHRSHHHASYAYEDLTLPERLQVMQRMVVARCGGAAMIAIGIGLILALASFSVSDPSFNNATPAPTTNMMGPVGAHGADILLQLFGGAAFLIAPPLLIWGGVAMRFGDAILPEEQTPTVAWWRFAAAPIAILLSAALMALAPSPADWPFAAGPGGVIGDGVINGYAAALGAMAAAPRTVLAVLVLAPSAVLSFAFVCGLTIERAQNAAQTAGILYEDARAFVIDYLQSIGLEQRENDEGDLSKTEEDYAADLEDDLEEDTEEDYHYEDTAEGEEVYEEEDDDAVDRQTNIIRETHKTKPSKREVRDSQPILPGFSSENYELPPLNLVAKPPAKRGATVSDEALEQNARMLENVLADFGVRGEIINVRPGPVVTLYELEPAAGVKSSRVIGLADDIARSMSAVAARVAVIPGRNAIGIELPNLDRETVYIRELLGARDYENTKGDLTLALGKSIGGEPVFADLARMPHLLIAGTTGSGKSVGINGMILSLLFRLPPDECKLIMVDPKMLELSVYEGIPHLLAPVVTDPRKAVVALKWTVKEMEERYRRMSKVGVRNIAGFNQRVMEADENGEVLTRTVHTGYDKESGEPIYETEELEYDVMPFIVVVIDEVADLMMVAGKDIEAMVQRLAQMARAAGIHLIMATQRPSVDVITGTIKANFPTRISFQVTSKIDSRTILGEQGAEQLLGQGDMLHMAGGGRVRRVHGAFVSDDEVEKIVAFLKKQGKPDYIQEVTEMQDEDGGGGLDIGGNTNSGDALYDKAVAVVLRDRKASTSYVQRRLQIGYNRAATLIERMEEDGVISAPNHAGKREILVGEDAA